MLAPKFPGFLSLEMKHKLDLSVATAERRWTRQENTERLAGAQVAEGGHSALPACSLLGGNGRKCLNSCEGGPGPGRATLVMSQATGGLATALLQFEPKPCSPGVLSCWRDSGGTRSFLGRERGLTCTGAAAGVTWEVAGEAGSLPQPRCQEGPAEGHPPARGPGSAIEPALDQERGVSVAEKRVIVTEQLGVCAARSESPALAAWLLPGGLSVRRPHWAKKGEAGATEPSPADTQP